MDVINNDSVAALSRATLVSPLTGEPLTVFPFTGVGAPESIDHSNENPQPPVYPVVDLPPKL